MGAEDPLSEVDACSGHVLNQPRVVVEGSDTETPAVSVLEERAHAPLKVLARHPSRALTVRGHKPPMLLNVSALSIALPTYNRLTTDRPMIPHRPCVAADAISRGTSELASQRSRTGAVAEEVEDSSGGRTSRNAARIARS